MIGVTVVAFFVPRHPGVDVVANHAITAVGNTAVTQAAVVVEVVPVIALFAKVQDAVAADRRLASADRRAAIAIA